MRSGSGIYSDKEKLFFSFWANGANVEDTQFSFKGGMKGTDFVGPSFPGKMEP